MTHSTQTLAEWAELKQVLDGAGELVKEGWTQGEWARDATGARVHPESTGACRFCMEGALKRAASKLEPDCRARRGNLVHGATLAIERTLADELEGEIADWNDEEGRTQEEVVAVIGQAADRRGGSWEDE